MKIYLSLSAILFMATTGSAQAGEYSVSGVHNCCGLCAKGITEALTAVEGVTEINAKAKETKISFAAPDDMTARKAIAALAKAGFHGTVEGGKVKYRDNSGVEAGKIKSLELVGTHNCCPGCANTIKDILAKGEGVESHTLEKKSVKIEGDFDGAAVVKALNDGGFHVRKKAEAAEKKDE
jgi:copper chaperone CopZ